MARYMQTASKLREEVNKLMEKIEAASPPLDEEQIAVQVGHIVNLAVRCSPRSVQGTVRKNIVSEAMKDYCDVTMTREQDPETKKEFNKIHIAPQY